MGGGAVGGADDLGDSDQESQKECREDINFAADKMAKQSDHAERQQGDLREVEIAIG
jgi:hypothetical protein